MMQNRNPRLNWPLKLTLFNCRTPNAPALIRELLPGCRDEKQTSAALQPRFLPRPISPCVIVAVSFRECSTINNFIARPVNGAERKILSDQIGMKT
jgi:hypothetical protein